VSGSVDLGIAAKSTVLADNMVKRGHWIDIDTLLYDPIPQGIAILSHGLQNHFPETKLLYDFLFSSDAQSILTKYGYGLP
jgi:molybdate transport system substrate-binding protein